MIGFLDNDIVLKLCIFDLLEESIVTLNLRSSDIRVLKTAEFVFKRSRSVLNSCPETSRERAIAFVKNCPMVSEENSDEFELLQTIDGIDIGEARLLAATQGVAAFVLLTGDKHCMASLGAAPELESIRQRLQGRVICLEQVVLLLIKRLGFEIVKARVLPTIGYDKSLQSCFGSGKFAIEANVVASLEGYIEALRQLAPGILADMNQF